MAQSGRANAMSAYGIRHDADVTPFPLMTLSGHCLSPQRSKTLAAA